MPFNDIEISEFGNEPIELYSFSRGPNFWRMTSSDRDITFQGNVYRSTAIRRGRIEATQDLGKASLKLNISRRASFLDQFISSSPTDIIPLVITRIHEGDTEQSITWKGRVVNVRFLENEAEVTCQLIYSSLKRPGLRRLYQTNCPHVLYGTECRLTLSSFAVNATLIQVNNNEIRANEFIININPSFDADWFVGGFVEFLNNNVKDRRFITNHNNTNGTLTLNLPFSGLNIGSQVTAFPGCSHTTTTCEGKFNNVLNYGGFPFIPSKNPMNGTPVF